jgi:hypothetical protein
MTLGITASPPFAPVRVPYRKNSQNRFISSNAPPSPAARLQQPNACLGVLLDRSRECLAGNNRMVRIDQDAPKFAASGQFLDAQRVILNGHWATVRHPRRKKITPPERARSCRDRVTARLRHSNWNLPARVELIWHRALSPYCTTYDDGPRRGPSPGCATPRLGFLFLRILKAEHGRRVSPARCRKDPLSSSRIGRVVTQRTYH